MRAARVPLSLGSPARCRSSAHRHSTRDHAEHWDLLANAFEPRDMSIDGQRRQDLQNARRIADLGAQIDLSTLCQVLYAGRDIHGLPEVVETLILGDGDRRAAMHADLQDECCAR